MIRTQIYLSEEEKEALVELSRQRDRSQSELIREALDQYLAQYRGEVKRKRRRAARGIWRDRDEIPDLRRLRDEFNRS